jgi:serine/threonine protein kinase
VIILDYVPGINLMTLFNEQRHIPLPRLKEILVDILSIIRECHSRNVIHRDIKPHNIIISPHGSEPKLIDFGLALVTSKEMESHNYYKCGTMGYTAP